ncbi:uncharacterized protein FSUBG_13054 [Fusarium subglutinans]|uniref:Ceramide glucosyltransferase n=1 Tax=Gibberella subglutinans TaxID=42677 RepID=A0A8H5NYU7_GIBSU|nr:uncharacterized protein FSUBG_13054 [Fusarium subglutinans]KAF5583642.1 hypothetical protein FSUBG_13054 [Fusarium subglutinans]
MGFRLQAADPGAIVSIVILAIIIAIRISGFAILQYGRWKYWYIDGRFNGSKAVSVILTIHDSNDPNLVDYVRSILKNKPECLLITTNNRKAQHRVDGKLKGLRFAFSDTKIRVGTVNEPNRRREIAHALDSVDTPFVVLTDQGVHWGEGFLKSVIIPFANHRVGCVTVPMMARKRDGIWGSFWTCLFSCYYCLVTERNRALNAFDSSVVFTGSPIMFRTKLVAQPRFKQQFEVDPCLNRRHGVHKADEYLFFNRYFLQEEGPHEEPCLVVFQDMPEVMVSVDRPSIAGFLSEYLQMTRNLWRLSRVMIRRKERSDDYGFGGTLIMAVLVGCPAYYFLGILKLVELATAWKADVELISEEEVKVRKGDLEAVRYHEARADIEEPPWISECMELERPQGELRPLPDFPLYVIAE